jgi:hypothetical protein
VETTIHPAIRRYLAALETKLRQSPGVHPEEGLADADEYLQSEWESMGDRQGSFSDDDLYRHFVRKFGHPSDVAEEYASASNLSAPAAAEASRPPLSPPIAGGNRWRLWVIVGLVLAVGVASVAWTLGPILFPQPPAAAVESRQVWASRVVSFTPGEPQATQSNEPASALGPPDCQDKDKDLQTYVALGHGGELILEFKDWFCDGEGPDLTVIEIGPLAEPCDVALSPDGQTWTKVGRALGAQSMINIAPFVKPGNRFRYVRLIDAKIGRNTRNAWPGADIDAVGAYYVVQSRPEAP